MEIIDPIQREAIAKRLAARNMCSVKLMNLPKSYNYASLLGLSPNAQACRIYSDPVSRKMKSHAYLEFSTSESALQALDKLNGLEFQGKKLVACVGGDLSENVDDYIPFSIRLYNLHWKTCKGELAKHFANATSIKVPHKNRSGLGDKKSTGVATLSFVTVDEVIAAFDEKQGCVIRGRRISVHFCSRKIKSKLAGLIVYGLKKTTKEEEVRALFPQAGNIDINPRGGFAVLTYELDEDCRLDRKNALGIELNNRKLKVFYKYQSGAKFTKHQVQQPAPKQEANTPLLFIKNLGRKATEDDVMSMFPKAKIISMPKRKNGCRGFAVIDCKSVISAKRIMAHNHVLHGRTLVIQPATLKKYSKDTTAWYPIDLVLFPGYQVSIALLSQVGSPVCMNQMLQSGKLVLSPEFCSIVDADLIVDISQVEAAANQALVNRTGSKLQGKGVFSSEFLASLHPNHSIKEATEVFGVKDSTKRVLIAYLQTPHSPALDFGHVNSHIPGIFNDPCSLFESFDRRRISEIYGLAASEFEKPGNSKESLVLSVITRMSAGQLFR